MLNGATDKRDAVPDTWPRVSLGRPLGCLVCDHSEALAGAPGTDAPREAFPAPGATLELSPAQSGYGVGRESQSRGPAS